MKAIRTMCLVAAAAMLLAACGKETTEAGTGIGNPEPHTDYLVFDGTAYPFVKETSLTESGFYQVVITPVNSSDSFFIMLEMKERDVNKPFDLTSSTEGNYSIEIDWASTTTFSLEACDGRAFSILSGTSYDDASAVSDGLFYTNLNEVDYSTELDLSLADGHRILLGTVTPVDSISYMPFCGGEALY